MWTMVHLFPVWLFTMTALLSIFYYLETKNTEFNEVDISSHYSNKLIISGKRNFIWLGIGIASVFLDPNLLDGLPYIDFHGKKLSFIREVIQLSAAFFCYKYSDRKALQANHFNFDAIKEVAFLFFGIFLCMMPAIQSLEAYAHDHQDTLVLHPGFIFWTTGFFSSVLDNAPTYLNVLTLILSDADLSIHSMKDMQTFISSNGVILLEAVSAGAVFFGAMTYIGNGPNFMVKSIAEEAGVKMPSFGKYIWRYSLPILLPILFLVWMIFY